jgi:quinohemoprotein ethanol dehydrogenase
MNRVIAGVALALCLYGCARETEKEPAAAVRAAWVDEERIANADAEPQNWYATNRGTGEDHYSPLSQINESNVGTLGFAWDYKTKTTRGLEASPLVIDGVMYTSGNWGMVYAVDAKTGAEIWTYDPKVAGEWARRACCDIVNRGVAAWKGKIYVGSLDGYLIAIDAATGKEVWRKDTLVDRSRYYTISGAPKIAGGKVVIGNGGADLGVRGYISAYDAETGEFAWRFFTVPGDPKKPFEHPEMEQASKTWDPNSMWDVGGGGTAWDAMAYDPALNLLYVGTGNGAPHPIKSRSPKGGDNLYLASILAINPDTGRLAWHYQTTPGENWDYTATQQMILADLDGRKVLMQAPKNGFFYILDRATGELLSAEKFGKANWASHVDMKTGRPVQTKHSDYSQQPKLIYPGQAGAHNWHAMSLNPKTGLVYIPLLELPMVYSYNPRKNYGAGEDNQQVAILSTDDPSIASQLPGGVYPADMNYLQAWDPLTQTERWRVAVEDVYEGSGVLSTGGDLVFQGTGAGFLNVYAAATGAQLASLAVGTGIMAAPISYSVDGEQYISVMAGMGGPPSWYYQQSSAAYRYGNDGRIVTFKLSGGAVPIPALVKRDAVVLPPPAVPTSPEMIARGEELFETARCTWCHVDGPGLVPDLFSLTPEKHARFKSVVYDGALKSRGMASFSDMLTEADVDAVHAYIVDETRKRIDASTQR